MLIVEDLPPDSPLLDVVYSELLAPYFPADELVAREELTAVAGERGAVTVALDERGAPVGTAVGVWSPDAGVLLLAYLAVRAEQRSLGAGGRLLAEVGSRWQRRFRPRVTLAELEYPLARPPHSPLAHGDPRARYRFYQRHGARALDLPYVQPSLRPGQRRVPGMLLLALYVATAGPPGHPRPGPGGHRALSGFAHPDGDGGYGRPDPVDGPGLPEGVTVPDELPGGVPTVDAEPVRTFLHDYFLATEGPSALTDPGLLPMWHALERPEGVRLLPMDAPENLPLPDAVR